MLLPCIASSKDGLCLTDNDLVDLRARGDDSDAGSIFSRLDAVVELVRARRFTEASGRRMCHGKRTKARRVFDG